MMVSYCNRQEIVMDPHPPWTDPHCPVARTADLVGDRWSLLIVRDAFDGLRRFGEFRTSLGIAKNILADRLRALTEHQILCRHANDRGTRTEYHLTPQGEQLFTVILALRQWGEAHAFSPEEPRSALVSLDGRPLATLGPATLDGDSADGRNTLVLKVTTPGRPPTNEPAE